MHNGAMTNDQLNLLSRTLDQLGSLVDAVHGDQADLPTPCRSWRVSTLLDHVLADLQHFITAASGDKPDWSTKPPSVAPNWASEFHPWADRLMQIWRSRSDDELKDAADALNLPIAEFAVHGWDLATALGRTDRLDPEVAEYARGVLAASLKPEYRGSEDEGRMFGPEIAVAADAPVHDRLAGIAGRDPAWSPGSV